MKHEMEYLFAIAAVGAIAAAAAIALPGTAHADDITVDTTPFVSSRSRADVRQELLGQAQQVRASATEWSLQQGAIFKGRITVPEARADFVSHRTEVSALTGEDSGAFYFKMKSLPPGGTTVMGGPRQ